MVQIDTSNFLDGKTAKEKGATSFVILEEFTYQEGKFGKKLQGKARFNTGQEGILNLNKTNQKKIAEILGVQDSKGWINKAFEFVIASQVVEGKLVDVIHITSQKPTL